MKKKIAEAKSVLLGLIPIASADLTTGASQAKGVAKKADVVELILLAMRSVKNATGIELRPEVKLVGEFDPRELPRGIP